MELRTTFNIAPSADKITYNDPVMFIGSCFATAIGSKFESGHLPVMINPSGTVYNPVSVCNTLDAITAGRKYETADLHNNKGVWLSFNHYTDFSSPDAGTTLGKINRSLDYAGKFLASARFLFLTFGTARIYRWKETGQIVSNCHKIPASLFSHELLQVSDIITLWEAQLNKLHSLYPELKVVFTISPVRHWKDGAHGNQVSKSVLFVAVEELLKHSSQPVYFPAYELLMDDLRDYRFYDSDMLHPSAAAVDYIWKAFSDCWLDEKTIELRKEIIKITEAAEHLIRSGSEKEIHSFAENMLARIYAVERKAPSVDLEREKKYFLNLS
jgi:hypothetical protein